MSIDPLYLVDYGKKAFHVLNRATKKIETLTLDEFRSLTWMKTVGNIAGESCHFRLSEFEDENGRRFKKSKAQPFNDEEQIKDFFARCKSNKIIFRLLPEISVFKFREVYMPGQKKGDEVDLLTWDLAITDRPSIWEVAQKTENVEFHDPTKPIDLNNLTPYLSGNVYKDKLKLASCIVSASDEDYKTTIPGELAYSLDCINDVAERLGSHNSDCGKIKNGVASITINGEQIELSLLEILGFVKYKRKNAWQITKLKEKQYVCCMMLLVDQEGTRYLNPLTGKPVGFKMVKQFGMVSSGLHRNPGFIRSKFYYYGTKTVSRKLFKKLFGIDKYSFGKLDYGNKGHLLLKDFVMTTCRIAYEQTIKAMIQYLDTPKHNLEKFVA